MEGLTNWGKLKRIQELKLTLHEIEEKLVTLAETFNWDCSTLLKEGDSDLVTRSANNQNDVPKSEIKPPSENCCLHCQFKGKSDKIFSVHAKSGSCLTLTSQQIYSVTKNITSGTSVLKSELLFKTNQNKILRAAPQTCADFDVNFSREEKLAIYDYVIANTQKQKIFKDLMKEVGEKKEEKREMTVWEIAAAERNAKRRRASYRNKVHTNCKTHTQILREVIEAQMETLKEESINEKPNEESKKADPEGKKKLHRACNFKNEEECNKRKYYDYNSRSKNDVDKSSRGNSGSRSRCYDKYKRWGTSAGRSHFHKSSR